MAKGRVSKMYDDTVDAIKGMVGAKKKKAKKPAKKGRKPAKAKAKKKRK